MELNCSCEQNEQYNQIKQTT